MTVNDTLPQWLKDEVKDYIIQLPTPPKTVLDIGASTGIFSQLALTLWPDCQIIAFEPLPTNANKCRELFRNTTVAFHEKAVRCFDGLAEFRLGDMDVTGGFHKLGRQTDSIIRVDCKNASTIPSCEFVKIDTEGCEVEILSVLDLSATKTIAVEYHTDCDRITLERHLSEKGFKVAKRVFNNVMAGVGTLVFTSAEPVVAPKKKVMVGIPVYGSVDVNFFKSALRLMAEFSNDMVVLPWCGDSLVSRARNSITAQFLKTDCTHLLMIDSDLVFSSEHINRILSHDEDVIGGFYPKKKEGAAELVCNALDPQPPMIEDRRITQLKYIGTGFLCVHRSVFEKMIEKHGEDLAYTCDSTKEVEHDFWSVGVYKYPDGTRRYLSEDWYFCQRCLDLGIKVWGDNGVLLRHSGAAVYPLSYQEKDLLVSKAEVQS